MVFSCGRIGEFNCDNRSQQHFEAIYGSFDFIGPAHTCWVTSKSGQSLLGFIVLKIGKNSTSTKSCEAEILKFQMQKLAFECCPGLPSFGNLNIRFNIEIRSNSALSNTGYNKSPLYGTVFNFPLFLYS